MCPIRPAEESDLPRLVEILTATYEGTMAAIVPPKALEAFRTGNEATRFAKACWPRFHVAERDGVVAGLLFVEGNRVESLHVHPDHARLGVGAALLSFGEQLIALTHDTAELDVLAGNANALAFYRSKGWVEVQDFIGREVGDVPAPMIQMSKRLP